MQIEFAGRMERVIDKFRSSRLDVLLALLLSVTLLLLIIVSSRFWVLVPLRLLLGFTYVLYIPGYWITASLFPGANDLDKAERIGLSLGLSVAWVPVLALLLDRSPWGLSLWPILSAEYISTLIFMAIALWRFSRLPPGQIYAPVFSWRPRRWWDMLPHQERQIFKVILAALLVAMLSLLWVFLVPSPAEFMTEFYMLGEEGLAEDFPRQAGVREELRVTLGITNEERAEHTYRVEVWAEDVWCGRRRLQLAEAGPFRLQRGENREMPISWQTPWSGPDQKVEILLFSGDDPTPYRRLYLILDVETDKPTQPAQCSIPNPRNQLQAETFR